MCGWGNARRRQLKKEPVFSPQAPLAPPRMASSRSIETQTISRFSNTATTACPASKWALRLPLFEASAKCCESCMSPEKLWNNVWMVLLTAVAVHLPPLLVVTLSAFNLAAMAFSDRPSGANASMASLRSSAASLAFSSAAATPLRWWLACVGRSHAPAT
jgi:hypothetical protein